MQLAIPPATKLLMKSRATSCPLTRMENAVPIRTAEAIEYQMEMGPMRKICGKMSLSMPISGSDWMIGKKANKNRAPSKETVTDAELPVYFG